MVAECARASIWLCLVWKDGMMEILAIGFFSVTGEELVGAIIIPSCAERFGG